MSATARANSCPVRPKRPCVRPIPGQAEAPLRQTYPGYVQFDINGGLSFGKWNANAFVQNLTDKRGLIGGGYYNQTNFNRYWFNLIAPRTVGLSLDYSF